MTVIITVADASVICVAKASWPVSIYQQRKFMERPSNTP